jgi:hypothetical protein
VGAQCAGYLERGTDLALLAGQSANSYLAAPILKIFVVQTWQEPSVAGRPFFIVIGLGSLKRSVVARVADFARNRRHSNCGVRSPGWRSADRWRYMPCARPLRACLWTRPPDS